MILVRTRLAVSPIQGIGLFAAEDIRKDTVIWKFHPYIDIKLSEEQIAELSIPCQEQFMVYAYKQRSTGLYVLCGDDTRFINHSDNPNCIDIKDKDGSGITIATRDIITGEELTCNYLVFDQDLIDGKYELGNQRTPG